jgi:hypothetical protein
LRRFWRDQETAELFGGKAALRDEGKLKAELVGGGGAGRGVLGSLIN